MNTGTDMQQGLRALVILIHFKVFTLKIQTTKIYEIP